ncbi:MAG: phosphotransferase [Anaerolineae bacterium]|nr:phosphotransferase [Anaerolineae bacterium]
MTRLTTPEIVELQNLCRRSLPERLDQHVSQFSLSEDDRHRTLSFALTWDEKRRPRVERLQVRGYLQAWTVWNLNDDAQVRRDWQVMGWLYGLGLPVPRVYASGQDYMLLECPTGRSVDSFSGDWQELVAPQIDEFARLLAQLHRLQPPEGVRQVLPLMEAEAELDRLGDIARQCLDAGLEETVSELKVWFGAEEREAFPPCVLCGEAIFARAQIDAWGITLPCWQDAARGDPRWDVAHAIAWLRARHADDLAERFLETYQARAVNAANIVHTNTLDAWSALAGAQHWALADWLREHQPEHPRAAERSMWIELTWRALTRINSTYGQI